MIRNYAKLSVREPILINVNDAKAKGVSTGDVVRVFNDRGEILVGTLATHHPKARHCHLRRCMLRP
ncbi:MULTISPECIES: molybdopterin dinucleotide binding domain-containing protein [Campylobacter]|uniref:molybdopterin dinucleotide binding domain-containing protein n=1 Tax=Campylobacter TaxID=194 RepID=UPI001E64DB81|nr:MULTISPECIES: molybdopterin dinucleotide binding domain-containing protein [Campylobacter]